MICAVIFTSILGTTIGSYYLFKIKKKINENELKSRI